MTTLTSIQELKSRQINYTNKRRRIEEQMVNETFGTIELGLYEHYNMRYGYKIRKQIDPNTFSHVMVIEATKPASLHGLEEHGLASIRSFVVDTIDRSIFDDYQIRLLYP